MKVNWKWLPAPEVMTEILEQYTSGRISKESAMKVLDAAMRTKVLDYIEARAKNEDSQ